MDKLNKLLYIVRFPFLLSALMKGVAAGVEHYNLIKSLDIKCVIDIGANRGQFALVARHIFSNVRIISFEPLSEAAQKFKEIFKDDIHTTLFECAIGPEETTSNIHITKEDDSSSLLPITDLQNMLYPGTKEITSRVIPVKPIYAVLKEEEINIPALLKIDVQGYEKHVLEGCNRFLPLFSYVYVECSFVELYVGQALAHEIIADLAEYGFILDGIYNLDRDEKGFPIQGDFLFTKQ